MQAVIIILCLLFPCLKLVSYAPDRLERPLVADVFQLFPQAPEKDGMDFLGWTDENGLAFSEKIVVSQDLRVQALYREKETAPASSQGEEETRSEQAPEEPVEAGTPWWPFAVAGAVLLLVCAGLLIGKKRLK